MASILDIQTLMKKPNTVALAKRLLDVNISEGTIVLPEQMREWANQTFHGADVSKQTIVRVTSKVLGEQALFNSLRALRPVQKAVSVNEDILDKSAHESFASPLTMTPSDDFGRITGKRSITAANVAKYDARHGLVIFQSNDPYDFKDEDILDFWETSRRWFIESNSKDKKAVYPFLMWNCLWRSGASMVHGHWQLLLTHGQPYEGVRRIEKASAAYKKKYGTSFWGDYAKLHSLLGLSIFVENAKAYVHVCPKKEKEIIIHAQSPEKLFHAVSTILPKLRSTGTESFDMVVYMPPLPWKRSSWTMPWLARIVDRGSLDAKTSDIGGMELYAASVVTSDPFKVAEALR
ncbi:MAG: hypothetical protein ABIA93_00630 [Candidatus Woesearchaeota archaeon]